MFSEPLNQNYRSGNENFNSIAGLVRPVLTEMILLNFRSQDEHQAAKTTSSHSTHRMAEHNGYATHKPQLKGFEVRLDSEANRSMTISMFKYTYRSELQGVPSNFASRDSQSRAKHSSPHDQEQTIKTNHLEIRLILLTVSVIVE